MTQEDYKARRRAKTREATAALVDDLSFFREVLVKEAPNAGDLRRLSAQLRRILVDGTLEKVAGPRVGKIKLLAPVIDEMVKLNRKQPYIYVGVGNVRMFGVEVAFAMCESGSAVRALTNTHPNARQDLDLEHFMKQGVMVFQGTWFSRREILRYMANVAEGIHSGEPKNDRERLIRRARHVSKMSLEGGIPFLSMNVAATTEIELPPLLSKSEIDGALVELWAAAELLAQSPDVIALEAYIEAEPYARLMAHRTRQPHVRLLRCCCLGFVLTVAQKRKVGQIRFLGKAALQAALSNSILMDTSEPLKSWILDRHGAQLVTISPVRNDAAPVAASSSIPSNGSFSQ